MRDETSPLAVRFWSLVQQHSPTARSSDGASCWEWMGYHDRDGYGRLSVNGTSTLAHRLAFMLEFGYMPQGHVLHDCDNPGCVNPDHLFVGTHADNMRDMARKHRAHAPRGCTNGRAKLDDAAVHQIRERYAAGGVSQSALAAEFGVSQGLISGIVTRRFWPHL